MMFIILSLCLASAVSAGPLPSSFFHYLPHYGGGGRPSGTPTQVNDVFPGQPQPGMVGAVSMEIVFPHGFPGTGGAGTVQAFLKYSLPQAPGRKSVEIYYPFDFSQQKMPQLPNLFQFDHPPQTVPQQNPIVPPFAQQDPMQQGPPRQAAQPPKQAGQGAVQP